jgi:PAS domain S-box-containing protein
MKDEMNSTRFDKILVVDDTTANLRLLTNLLTAHGYTVYPASDGELALEFVRSTLPDLILMDIRMPGMDGYEVCRRLKADERTRSIPVIFISILEDERDKVKGFQAGGVDYITKPFQAEEVLARVRTHLRLQKLTVRLEQEVRQRTDELATTNQLLLQELAERQRAEALLRESKEKYRGLIQRIQAAVVVHGADTRILTSNLQAQQLLGLTEAQMMGKAAIDPDWHFFREDGTTMPVEEYPVNRVLTTGQPLRDAVAGVHRSTTKEDVWVLVSADPVVDEQGEMTQVIVTFVDITARRKAQADLHRMNRQLRAISTCNQVLMQASDEQTLLGDICRIVCEVAGYRMAWVGYRENDDGKTIRPVAWAGIEQGYLAEAKITWADTERGRGPTGRAVREGVSTCIQDFATDALAAPWRESALQRGYRSSIALPLKKESAAPFGALCIYSAQPGIFAAEEMKLLDELAGNLAFGISVLRTRTARKQADQDVALMSVALNNVREAAFLINAHSRFVYVNEEACRALGYTRAELLSKGVADVDPDFPTERWPDHWRELATRRAMTFESRHKTGDGRVLPVEINANYIEYGQKSYNLALVRDITERKQAEQERLTHLRFFENMDRVNRAIQGAGDLDAMMKDLLDVVLSIFDCDRAFLLYPCDPASPTWNVPMERTKPDYPGALELKRELPMDPQVAETLRILLAADGPVAFGPGTPHALPGDVPEQFGFKCFMAMAIYPKTGGPWLFGIHQCTHARVWTSEEERLFQEIGRRLADGLSTMLAHHDMQRSEERLRLTLEATQIGIWDWDVANDRYLASPIYYTMLGYEPKEGPADRSEWVQQLHPDDKKTALEQVDKVLSRTCDEYSYEARFRHADGSYKWQWVFGYGAGHDKNGKLTRMLGLRIDIDKRKRMEEELSTYRGHLEELVRRRTAQLEAANSELESLAYTVSHNLRAPLRHIDGFIELLQKRSAAPLDEQSRHCLDNVADAARHMGALVDDLLSFLHMGRTDMTTQTVDLAGLIREVIQELAPETCGRTIHWQIADLPVVTGDRAMLRTALVNLIANALKFTLPRPQARIEIGSLPGQASEAVVFVRDNGVGFDMTYADKLFDVFQRLHRTEEFEGTGIGLANVRRIIARHGGRTWAEGKPDQGAAFYFSLPQLTPGG